MNLTSNMMCLEAKSIKPHVLLLGTPIGLILSCVLFHFLFKRSRYTTHTHTHTRTWIHTNTQQVWFKSIFQWEYLCLTLAWASASDLVLASIKSRSVSNCSSKEWMDWGYPRRNQSLRTYPQGRLSGSFICLQLLSLFTRGPSSL
jgi:hypothetical protein